MYLLSKIFPLPLAMIMSLGLIISPQNYALQNTFFHNLDIEKESNIDIESTNDEFGINFGSYSGTAFGKTSFVLNRKNGKYIRFWAKNTGEVDVRLKINDTIKQIIKPGEEGVATEELISEEDTFVFEAIPPSNGGKISLDYRISQIDGD